MRGSFLILLVVSCFFGYLGYQVYDAANRVAGKLNERISIIQQQGK
jgi:hypothetical protein